MDSALNQGYSDEEEEEEEEEEEDKGNLTGFLCAPPRELGPLHASASEDLPIFTQVRQRDEQAASKTR